MTPWLVAAMRAGNLQEPDAPAPMPPHAAEQILSAARQKHSHKKARAFLGTRKPIAADIIHRQHVSLSRFQFGDGEFQAGVASLQRYSEAAAEDVNGAAFFPEFCEVSPATRTLSRVIIARRTAGTEDGSEPEEDNEMSDHPGEEASSPPPSSPSSEIDEDEAGHEQALQRSDNDGRLRLPVHSFCRQHIGLSVKMIAALNTTSPDLRRRFASSNHLPVAAVAGVAVTNGGGGAASQRPTASTQHQQAYETPGSERHSSPLMMTSMNRKGSMSLCPLPTLRPSSSSPSPPAPPLSLPQPQDAAHRLIAGVGDGDGGGDGGSNNGSSSSPVISQLIYAAALLQPPPPQQPQQQQSPVNGSPGGPASCDPPLDRVNQMLHSLRRMNVSVKRPAPEAVAGSPAVTSSGKSSASAGHGSSSSSISNNHPRIRRSQSPVPSIATAAGGRGGGGSGTVAAAVAAASSVALRTKSSSNLRLAALQSTNSIEATGSSCERGGGGGGGSGGGGHGATGATGRGTTSEPIFPLPQPPPPPPLQPLPFPAAAIMRLAGRPTGLSALRIPPHASSTAPSPIASSSPSSAAVAAAMGVVGCQKVATASSGNGCSSLRSLAAALEPSAAALASSIPSSSQLATSPSTLSSLRNSLTTLDEGYSAAVAAGLKGGSGGGQGPSASTSLHPPLSDSQTLLQLRTSWSVLLPPSPATAAATAGGSGTGGSPSPARGGIGACQARGPARGSATTIGDLTLASPTSAAAAPATGRAAGGSNGAALGGWTSRIVAAARQGTTHHIASNMPYSYEQASAPTTGAAGVLDAVVQQPARKSVGGTLPLTAAATTMVAKAVEARMAWEL